MLLYLSTSGTRFTSGSDVKLDVQISKVAAHRLKLVVCEHDGNSTSPSDVGANKSFEMFNYVDVVHAVKFAS